MAVKIRLQRKGRKKAPFYHIVIADARSPRDGKYITRIGSYNPMTQPATIDLDRDEAYNWLGNGAQPTDTVRAILRFKGVYVKRHLMRGVAKGAFTEEVANEKWAQWIEEKDAKIAVRSDKTKADKAAFLKAVHGEAKPKAKPVEEEVPVADDSSADAVENTAPASEEAQDAPVAESTPETAESAATEAVPADETPDAEATAPVEETPVAEEAPAAEATASVEETPVVEEAPAADADANPKDDAKAESTETPAE
ncbi:MAG TPA: 30S ribosomal protein S16 [Saprospiraceae bacterium]|nr:30S ribosomal protein S16 [Saprospiraceae bacterium]HQW56259.1 30S ribosomal protein S16 [Saprospiraceae bacterium]